jgi:hypothetical protein
LLTKLCLFFFKFTLQFNREHLPCTFYLLTKLCLFFFKFTLLFNREHLFGTGKGTCVYVDISLYIVYSDEWRVKCVASIRVLNSDTCGSVKVIM